MNWVEIHCANCGVQFFEDAESHERLTEMERKYGIEVERFCKRCEKELSVHVPEDWKSKETE